LPQQGAKDTKVGALRRINGLPPPRLVKVLGVGVDLTILENGMRKAGKQEEA
jgi:hypothetical protein